MYIIKQGPIYLQSFGETDSEGNTKIDLTMDPAKAKRFDTFVEAEAVNDRYEVGGKVVRITIE